MKRNVNEDVSNHDDKSDEFMEGEDGGLPRHSLLQNQDWRNPKSAPRRKGVGNCEGEEQGISQHVPLGIFDLGPFGVLSAHGDSTKDDAVVDESSEESTETTATVTTVFLVQGDQDLLQWQEAQRWRRVFVI